MRTRRFGGLLASAMLVLVLAPGASGRADTLSTDALTTDTRTTDTLTTDDLTTDNLVPSLPPIDGDDVALPLDPMTPESGSPEPGGSAGGSPSGDGTGTSSGSGSSDGSSGESPVGSTGDASGSGTPVEGSESAPSTLGAQTTLTGSAGTLASNIGKLAGPLGVPLGLALVAAVILLIATRRPVALQKVEEEGTWGYEGRSHRL